MPFLTLEDPRARIKGSRDPLGAQAVWSSFGRTVVANLTTVTTSVRNFTVLMLGRYYADRLIADGRIDEKDALDAFLRFEQVAAYVRDDRCQVREDSPGEAWSVDEVEIRGITRVARRVDDDRRRIPIGLGTDALIMTDQKTYGLWGLYTVAARVSGLVPPDRDHGVTPQAREFIERRYAPVLAAGERDLLRMLEKGGTLNLRRNEAFVDALAAVLDPAFDEDERKFYGDLVRDAKTARKDDHRQAALRGLLERHTLDDDLGRAELTALVKAANHEGHGRLATDLERIGALEAFLAPAASLFGLTLESGQRTPREVADDVADRWGTNVPHLDRREFAELLPVIRRITGSDEAHDPADDLAHVMDTCHAALVDADYEAAVEAMVWWNTVVMRRRKAGPWVTLDPRGRLDVRYRQNDRVFPSGDDLPELWHNPYFINSLKAVTRDLQEPAA